MSTPATLVVVCGAPASDKATLARRLAQELRLPLLDKDVIKEALAESVDTPDGNVSWRIGTASMNVMFALACATLCCGSRLMTWRVWPASAPFTSSSVRLLPP